LPILAKHRSVFERNGVNLIISSRDVIDTCSDKLKTAKFLADHGLDTPATFSNPESALDSVSNNEVSFPLIVKPRWGSASIGIRKVCDAEELDLAYRYTQLVVADGILAKMGANAGPDCDSDHSGGVIVQEWIDGDEYGLDVLNDLDGNFRFVYAKRKMGMRAGETDRAALVDCALLESVGARIGAVLGHIGNLDVDVFKAKSDGRLVVLEMNPRFGGGYPFSHELGARYPHALVAWLGNRAFDNGDQMKTFNKIIAKCDQLVDVTQY
jgi:carbamoyl-phosphate synthase large subunit